MAILPWLVPLLVRLVLITYVPQHVAVAAALFYRYERSAMSDRSSASRSCRSTCRRRSCAPTRSSRSSAGDADRAHHLRRRRAGHRLHLHDRHRRLVGGGAAARPPRAAADRRGRRRGRAAVEAPVLPHPRDRRRRDHQPRARRDRHRAVGPALPARRAAAVEDAPAARSARCRCTRPKAAGCTTRAQQLVDETRRGEGAGIPGRQDQGRQAGDRRGRRAARRGARRRSASVRADGRREPGVDRRPRRCAARRRSRRSALAWLEEPLPAEDLGGHVELAARAPMPIAVGESIYHPSHFREYLERGACSIVQVDCARIGGITPWLKVAHLAETFNVAGVPAFPDGAARVADRGGAERRVGRVHPAARRDHDVAAWPCADGHAIPPSTPGLGIDWDFAAIDRARRRARDGRTDAEGAPMLTRRLARPSASTPTTTSSSPARSSSAAPCSTRT